MVSISIGQTKINAGDSFENAPRVLLEEDSYGSKILRIGDTYKRTGKFKDDKTGELVEKTTENYVIEFTLNNDTDKAIKKECVLVMFLTTKVTEPGKNYKASKTYELLEKAGLLDELEEESKLWASFEGQDALSKAFTNFLKDKLLGKECKVVVKNITSKDTKEKYSIVEKVLKFL